MKRKDSAYLNDRILYAVINEIEIIDLNFKKISSTVISEKDIDFTGKRTKKGGQGKITIYNSEYEFSGNNLNVELWGGYNEPFLIFNGDVTEVQTGENGIDTFLTLQCVDGNNARKANKFKSYVSNTELKGMVKDMLDDLKKVGIETAEEILSKVTTLFKSKKSSKGFARKNIISGINKILSGAEKESEIVIHNKVLDIVINDQIGGEIVNLNPSSGLIGTVQKSIKIEKGKMIQTLNATSLMFYNYKIGQRINIAGIRAVISGIDYSLSNYKKPFYANIEAKAA